MKRNTWLRISCLTGLLAYGASFFLSWLHHRQMPAPRSGGFNIHISFSSWEIALMAFLVLAPALYFIWNFMAARSRKAMKGGSVIILIILFVATATALYLMNDVAWEAWRDEQRKGFDILDPLAFLRPRPKLGPYLLAHAICLLLTGVLAVVSFILLVAEQKRLSRTAGQ